MNRLSQATSPYLRQHAANPVDWYPWGDEALARARAEDKPLFVSIGYAACHWCHVMAHESFEDPAVAEDLSRDFVPVKVDREERPDVDALYMAAVQATTGAGGWPMSVFCTPDGRPFFAGTYFPPTDRHGMPSFRRVLAGVATAWRDRRTDVEAQASALTGALQREATVVDRLAAGALEAGADAPEPGRILDDAADALAARFDETFGGFGPAPKFPRPTFIELCLRHYLATGRSASLHMATRTLDAMAAGGIYDHVEGGFARYSTDARWLVPHFEKMLTDQALLARSYVRAWQATGQDRYLQVASETIEFVLDSMSVEDGGLCASLDADAEGTEGGHVTWTPAQVREALSQAGIEEISPICEWYGISEKGNWEHGRSVPHRPVGAPLGRPPQIEAARRALLAARRLRPQPSRDEKVLTEWNAMFAASLAEAAAACGNDPWAERAIALGTLLFERHRRPDGRWLRAAGTDIPAFAADYAWLVECCTRLAELTGRALWSARAEEIAAELLDLFFDPTAGGIFTSGHDAERLVVRAKELVDGAVPSANAAAAQALVRLGMLTGNTRWREAADRLLALAAPLVRDQPLAAVDLAIASLLARGSVEILISGDRPDLLAEVRSHWLPDSVVAWGEPTASPLWEGRSPAHRGSAYVCRQFTCAEPAHDAATLRGAACPLLQRCRRVGSGQMGGEHVASTVAGRRARSERSDVVGSRRQGRHAPAHARRVDDNGSSPPSTVTAPVTDPAAPAIAPARAPDEQPSDRQELSGRAIVRGVTRRDRTALVGGAQLRLVILACTEEDTTAIDIASGALVRLRVPWPAGHEPDLTPFDVVEAELAQDPERDDLAQPEAVSVSGLPRHVGTLRGRRVRHMLQRLSAPPDGPLLGFPGASAPYWEFRGLRPSVALVKADRDPQLLRRPADGSTWLRFGWERDDVWLPVKDRRALRALDASRADRLSGDSLATALGFTPQYLVAAVSQPREGHCYKVCTALLPRE